MDREKKFFKVRKCQGILSWVRENWHFEEKSGKIEIVRLIKCHQRSEETFEVKWVQRTALIGGWRPLPYLKFSFIWSEEFNFYQGKDRKF